MANGLWQYVETDAQLHPGPPLADMYTLLLQYSFDQALSEGGYYWNDWDKFTDFAQRHLGVDDITTLSWYWYSDVDTIITMIFSKEPLDVMNKKQPVRVLQEYTVDPTSGLITQSGVILATTLLFQACAPVSRLP